MAVFAWGDFFFNNASMVRRCSPSRKPWGWFEKKQRKKSPFCRWWTRTRDLGIRRMRSNKHTTEHRVHSVCRAVYIEGLDGGNYGVCQALLRRSLPPPEQKGLGTRLGYVLETTNEVRVVMEGLFHN